MDSCQLVLEIACGKGSINQANITQETQSMPNIARTFVSQFFVSLPIKAQPNQSSVKSEKHEGKPFIKISDAKYKVLFVAFSLRSQKEPTVTPLILTRQSSRASFLITAIFIDVFIWWTLKAKSKTARLRETTVRGLNNCNGWKILQEKEALPFRHF